MIPSHQDEGKNPHFNVRLKSLHIEFFKYHIPFFEHFIANSIRTRSLFYFNNFVPFLISFKEISSSK